MQIKDYKHAFEFFLKAVKSNSVNEVILFHNQLDVVRKLLKEVCAQAGRAYIEKDLTNVSYGELYGIKIENRIPEWLKPVFEDKDAEGFLVFLEEFHNTSNEVKTAVLNILIKKEVENLEFPCHTLIVLGVRDEDETARAIGHTHTVEFYKQE